MPHDPQSPLIWTADERPRSRLYNDIYFSAEDGLAESRAVFLGGCGLPDAWAGRARFVVGELGFGSGLNIAALLDLWRRARPDGGRLHIFSIEAHPITAEEAGRCLAPWPELADIALALTGAWPGRARGFHRVDLPDFHATLDVAVMEAADALAAWTGKADAWFLDGFSPAVNPRMWQPEVLAGVAQRSAPGARAATFTVAGEVRRGLEAQGFTVAKQPGHGRKRQRLEARLDGRPSDPAPGLVAIIGAGIAGAAAARAVRAAGGQAVLIEAETPGSGGSGNPAALVTPRLDAGLGPPARLFAQAFARAVRLYDNLPGALIAKGVRQLATTDKDPARFARIAASDLFEAGALALGEAGSLNQSAARVIEPAAVLSAWAGEVRRDRVAQIARDGDVWSLRDGVGGEILRAGRVIIASAMSSADLVAGLPLQPVRGQASWVVGEFADVGAVAWGGYALPTRDGLLFGATHDRDDVGLDVRAPDHVRNTETLAKALPELVQRIAGLPLHGRASIRAVTPDRLPLAGATETEGLYLLTGFGSRGFSMAPLLAEHVAALALGAPSPLPADLQPLVDPLRFQRRAARRSGS
jgi:tRNA 5-methylaminomethyl-2-thiouridine biosynthesis bifunctional protein